MAKSIVILAASLCAITVLPAVAQQDMTGRLEERAAYRMNGVTIAPHRVWHYGRTNNFVPAANQDGVVDLVLLDANGREVHTGFPVAAGPGVTGSGVHDGAFGTPLLRIGFPRGSSALTPDAVDALRDVLLTLGGTESRVLVSGFTDSLGSEALNDELAQRRANRVAEFLKDGGVAPGRIASDAEGRCCYVGSNATAEGRARNRRVDIFEDTGEN